MITKNPIRQLAYTYSGRSWMMWLLALTQSMVAVSFLVLQRHSTPILTWLGALSALVALIYYGGIIYYFTHRAQLADSPANPISWKRWVWTIAITLVVIAVFVALVLFVWHS